MSDATREVAGSIMPSTMGDGIADVMRRSPGAPQEPLGNPMLSNMGPASFANRADAPDLTLTGLARIVPLRAAPGFHLDTRSPDPRGMAVLGADNALGGIVTDVWVDRAEPTVRYYEVSVAGMADNVLLPATCARIKQSRREVMVKSILGSQFADVPRTARPDRVTLQEEDRIMAYYASGYLYATPARQEPLL